MRINALSYINFDQNTVHFKTVFKYKLFDLKRS